MKALQIIQVKSRWVVVLFLISWISTFGVTDVQAQIDSENATIIDKIAELNAGILDNTDYALQQIGYTPHSGFLQNEWRNVPGVQKLALAYSDAENYIPGEGSRMLAMLAQSQAQQYESPRSDPILKPLLDEAKYPKARIRFKKPIRKPIIGNIKVPFKHAKQIRTLAKYTDGRTIALLKGHFGLDDAAVFKILENSKTTKAALKRGLEIAPVPPTKKVRLKEVIRHYMLHYDAAKQEVAFINFMKRYDKKLFSNTRKIFKQKLSNLSKKNVKKFIEKLSKPYKKVINKKYETLGIEMYKELKKRYQKSIGIQNKYQQEINKGERILGKKKYKQTQQAYELLQKFNREFRKLLNEWNHKTQGKKVYENAKKKHDLLNKTYRKISRDYPNEIKGGFKKLIRRRGTFGGIILGNNVTDRTKQPNISYIRFTPAFFNNKLPTGNLEFVFANGKTQVVSNLYLEDLLAAYRLVFDNDFNYTQGNGIGLIGMFGSRDSLNNHYKYVSNIQHPAIADLKLGWACAITDVLPRALGEISSNKKPDLSLLKLNFILDASFEMKIIDTTMIVKIQGGQLIVGNNYTKASNLKMIVYDDYKGKWADRHIFSKVLPLLEYQIHEVHRVNEFARVLALFRWAKQKASPQLFHQVFHNLEKKVEKKLEPRKYIEIDKNHKIMYKE